MKPALNWEKVKFGDIAKRINDTVPNRKDWTFDRYISGAHFDEGEIRIKESAPIKGNEEVIGYQFHWRFKPGDLLYVVKNPRLRKAGIVDFEGLCSISSFVIRSEETKFMQNLLPFLFQTESFTYHSCNNAHGSTNPFLNWKDIAKYEFLLPPIMEQKKISEILWSIENTLEKLEIYCRKFEKYKKKIHAELYKKSSSKFISFKEIIKLKKGKKPKVVFAEKENGSLPYINTDYLRINEIFSYAMPGEDTITVDNGDVILLWDGSNAGEILVGKKGILSSTMVKLYFDKNKYDVDFVRNFLALYEHFIKTSCQGTGIPHIDRVIIENLRFPILDLKKQKEISKTLNLLDEYEDQIKTELTCLKNLRNKLSNELLSGSLRLD